MRKQQRDHYYKRPKITKFNVNEKSILMDFLLNKMGGMKRNSVKSLLRHRQVSVNDKVITQFDYALLPKDSVSINSSNGNVELQHPLLKIIYEDSELIAVEKKEGLLTVTTGTNRDITAFSILKNYVKKASPANKIYTVHRLDRETSGVIIFAKNRDLQHELRNNWHSLVTKRTYIALVEGVVGRESGTIESWLTEEEVSLKVLSSNKDNGGKFAVTHFNRLKTSKDSSILEIDLETGRRNQIRVHLQSIGHPIVGDRKYGAKTTFGRVALHAYIIELIHPLNGKTLRFESPIPADFQKN